MCRTKRKLLLNNFISKKLKILNNEDIKSLNNDSVPTCSKKMKDSSTQTTFCINTDLPHSTRYDWHNIKDLIDILLDMIPNYNSKHIRLISMIFYLTLRIINLPFLQCKRILDDMELLNIQSCITWTNTIISNDDISEISRDNRGVHGRSTFYQEFPELEQEAKAFALDAVSRKNCSFTVKELADFVDKRFREHFNMKTGNQYHNKNIIRSTTTLRIDLIKWGFKFSKNKNRPYFLGHERVDVVEARKRFIDYFQNNKDSYYYPLYDVNNNLTFNKPLLSFALTSILYLEFKSNHFCILPYKITNVIFPSEYCLM
jgi:hypothetical protein